MIEMIMLSLLPKVLTTIESHLWHVYKKLSTISNTDMKKSTIMLMFGVMKWGRNLDFAMYIKWLASTVLPGKRLSWYYNVRHHGKGPMDGIGEQLLMAYVFWVLEIILRSKAETYTFIQVKHLLQMHENTPLRVFNSTIDRLDKLMLTKSIKS